MWIVQFCSHAYFEMVSRLSLCSILYPCLTPSKLGQYTSRRGDNRSTDVVCSIGSGPRLSKPAGPLYARLNDFGAIKKFKTLRRDKKPTFFVAFSEHQIASDVVDVLDGQYLMVRAHILPCGHYADIDVGVSPSGYHICARAVFGPGPV